METLKVSAADFQRNIGRYQDIALRQPVAVTRNGRESCVLISVEEFNRLKRRDREVLRISQFTEQDAENIRISHAPVEAQAFDDELKT
jgi:prevent-host-death family protein